MFYAGMYCVLVFIFSFLVTFTCHLKVYSMALFCIDILYNAV